MESCEFVLTADEASWLTERIVDAEPETLLAFLVANGARPAEGMVFPWEEPAASEAPERIRETLGEARRFALALHGAALLYNVLLAERADELGLSKYEGLRDVYAARLDEWAEEVAASDLAGWDTSALWALVTERGSLTFRTRTFVDGWLELARGGVGRGLANHRAARELVTERELHQKRSQARLRNDRLMRQWGGASGQARLSFRWPVVQRLLRDVAEARGRDSASA